MTRLNKSSVTETVAESFNLKLRCGTKTHKNDVADKTLNGFSWNEAIVWDKQFVGLVHDCCLCI